MIRKTTWTLSLFISLVAAHTIASLPASCQYTKGQQVDYKEGEYSQWQTGTVEYMTPSGKQVIVRSKPREFYPNGDTRAIDLDKIRPATGAVDAAPNNQSQVATAAAGANQQIPQATPQAAPQAIPQGVPQQIPTTTNPASQAAPQVQQGAANNQAPGPMGPVMTAQDVVNLFAQKIGDPKRLSWPENDRIYEEVASIIRNRGVNFDFKTQTPQFLTDAINKYQVTSRVTGALRQNWGPPANLNYYVGGWDMSKVGGETRVRQFVPGYDLVTSEHGALAGDLKIYANNRYEWNGISGSWRTAKPDELAMSDKGGAGIVLENAKEGARGKDWIVFKHSMTAGDNIEVADLNYRGVREYAGRH